MNHPADCGCAAHHVAERTTPRRRALIEDTTLGARSATEVLRRRLLTRFARAYATWQRTVAGLPEGAGDALRDAENAMGAAFHDAIDSTWRDAYRMGIGSRGGSGAARKLPPSILGDVDRQRRFATSFAQDIAAGTVGKKGHMHFGPRATLYANGIEGAFNYGAVDGGPEGELIWWRLGSGDSCSACPVLAAMSPYTRSSIPTTPRAGSTPCLGNCKCFLEFGAAPPAPRANPTPRPFADEVLDPAAPPPGFRLPSPEEEALTRDLELSAIFAARKAAAAKRATDRATWIGRRRSATAQADELAAERGFSLPRPMPPDAVVTGETIDEAGIMDMVRTRGLDGATAKRGHAAVGGAMDGALTGLAGLFAALAAFSAGADAAPGLEGDEDTLLTEAVSQADVGARVMVSVVGNGLNATLRAHVAALGVLSETGAMVEIGPYGARWPELVAAGGTWVAGAAESVASFLTAWQKVAYSAGGLAVAPWRERA